MQRLFYIVCICFLLSFAGCNECRDAREKVIQPVRDVTYYLNTHPSGEELENKSCNTIIDQLKDVPQGVELIKKMAHTRFIDDPPHCIRSEVRYRWVCVPWAPPPYPPYTGGPSCRMEPYTVCLEEEDEDTREEGYKTAIQLSRDLEEMHVQTHALCKAAMDKDYSGAEKKAKNLAAFSKEKVLIPGEKVYRSVCDSL